MKKMKKMCALLMTASMVLALAACGNDNLGSQNNSESSQNTQGSSESNAPENSGNESADNTGSGEDIIITYWSQCSENENDVPILKDAIARFEANNPGYKVEVNWASRDVRDILRTSIESGIALDIIDSGFDMIITVGEENLTDLTPYMEGSEFEASFTEAMASFAKSYSSDGNSWYYIPYNPFVGTFYCNMDIFEAAGIEAMPATWDEFLDCCQKIKDAGYDPITVDDAYQQSMYGHYLYMMKGTEWVEQLLTQKDPTLWDDPAVLQMAKDFAELREKGYLSSTVGSNVFPTAQNGEFALGTAAMYYNGSWVVNEIADITGEDFNWGAMFFPAPDNAIYPNTMYSTGCQFLAVTKNCEHPEAALALISEFLSRETLTAKAELAAIPAISGMPLPAKLTFLKDVLENSTDAFVWGGGSAQDGDIRAIFNAAFTDLLVGTLTPEQFVETVKSQLK